MTNTTPSFKKKTLGILPLFFLSLLAIGCKNTDIVNTLPLESADADSLQSMTTLSELPVLKQRRYQQFSSYQRDGEEQPPSSGFDNLVKGGMPFLWEGNYDANHFICKGNDAKTKDSSYLPLIFDQEQCAESYVKGAVMARYDGSGVMNRFWLTQIAALAKTGIKEIFRVYIDDIETPLYEVKLKDIYSGKAGEIFAAPFGAENGNFIAWNYPISFSSKLVVTLDNLNTTPYNAYYYHINANIDSETRTRNVSTERSPLRDQALQFLSPNNTASNDEIDETNNITLTTDFTDTLQESMAITGPGTIKNFTILYPSDRLQDLENIQLQIQWDNNSSNAVELSLLDFFSASISPPGKSNLILGSNSSVDTNANEGANNSSIQALSLSLPMPFLEQANITVVATTSLDFSLQLKVEMAVNQLPSEPWGYLSTQYHETLPAEELGDFHTLFNMTGKGRLAGVCAQMEGKQPTNSNSFDLAFLEGDEIGIIDGELAIPGTGTEDYFNSSFYFAGERPFATPFAQYWDRDFDKNIDRGRVSTCRWHLFNDTIDFQNSIDFKLEIGALMPELLVRYRTVAYYYQD